MVIIGIKHGIYSGQTLKCEGLSESDICSRASLGLGVKIRRGFHVDPANVEGEEEEEDGSFRHLQCMNFRTACTVFLICSFSGVFLISLSLLLQGQDVVWTAMQGKDLTCSKDFCGCVKYAVMQDCF